MQSAPAVYVFVAAADMFGALVLLLFGLKHAWMALKNSTTTDPTDPRYDVGHARNWRQVFGAAPLAWVLPLPPDGCGADGVLWPVNPKYSVSLATANT